ncbi:unnamed protein product [Scytosiphon promiscuus]
MSGLTNPVVGTCSVAIATKMPWNDVGYCPPQVEAFANKLSSRTLDRIQAA